MLSPQFCIEGAQIFQTQVESPSCHWGSFSKIGLYLDTENKFHSVCCVTCRLFEPQRNLDLPPAITDRLAGCEGLDVRRTNCTGSGCVLFTIGSAVAPLITTCPSVFGVRVAGQIQDLFSNALFGEDSNSSFEKKNHMTLRAFCANQVLSFENLEPVSILHVVGAAQAPLPCFETTSGQ